jgi:hypothetical protein
LIFGVSVFALGWINRIKHQVELNNTIIIQFKCIKLFTRTHEIFNLIIKLLVELGWIDRNC